MRGREELKREGPVLTPWLRCLLAPTVQKSGTKQVFLKGPGKYCQKHVWGQKDVSGGG